MPARRRRTLAFALLIGAAVLAANCASARIRRDTTLGLKNADTLVTRGCHACLSEALAIYQRLQPRDAPTRQLVARGVFRTSLLLALREKEIGLGATAHLERARAFAAGEGSAADRERVDLADAVPWSAAGQPRDLQMQQTGRVNAARERLLPAFTSPSRASDDPELDAYIALSIVCTARQAAQGERAPDTYLPAGEPSLLLRYRLGACGVAQEEHLNAALAAEPRFVETAIFTARYRLVAPAGRQPGRAGPRPAWSQARDALQRAYAAFPESNAIVIELANLVRTSSYRDALPLYTAVTVRVPRHHDAWYGKGLCESYLRQHEEAVRTLTSLLDVGQWLTADALYWRAWNRHQLKQLEEAWVDVQAAKKLLYSTEVFALSGIIAHDRGEFDVARPELERALEISDRNCAAAWYLGLTNAAQEKWPSASGAFEKAAACYRLDAKHAESDLVIAQALEESPSKGEQIDAARAALEESRRQEALSAYNAAYGFVRAQEVSRARPWLELARQHADVRARADELIAWVDRR